MLVNKFNDENALAESYQKLEKEFTKKCQELSKLKQELLAKESVVSEETIGANDTEGEEFVEVVMPEGVESTAKVVMPEEVVVEQPSNMIVDEEVVKPTQNEYFNLDFRVKAGEFMRKSPEAKSYAKEISKILLKDKSLLNCSDPFGVAFALALKNSNKKAECNENRVSVEEVVLDNPEREVPKVSVLSGSIVGLAPRENKRKFVSISDAGEEVMKRYF